MPGRPPERGPGPPRPHPARLWALLALRQVEEGLTIGEAFAAAGNIRNASAQDRPLAKALVYEAVRHKSYLDWLAGKFLNQPGRKLTLMLKAILRLGLAQILFFDRLPNHAAVMETVNLAKFMARGSEGLVNALLRSVLRAEEAGRLPRPEDDQQLSTTARKLAVSYSHPLWLVERELAAHLQKHTEARLAANNQIAPLTLRVNSNRTTRDQLAQSLQALGLRPKLTRYSPWGLNLVNGREGPVDSLPGFRQGLFSIQDEASQLALLAATDKLPNQAAILDAGAGFGGKTTGLAQIRPEATLVACDADYRKLARIPPEIERLGLRPPLQLVPGDLADPAVKRLLKSASGSNGFDLVFLDAPCSGLGVIRRRPDLKWRKTPEDIRRLARKQLLLLTAAEELLRPGGRLLYAVCTTTHEETWKVVEEFLKAARVRLTAPDILAGRFLTDRSCLSFGPEPDGPDGFFAAVFTLDK